MRYIGLQSQIRRNNRLSVLLLLFFPAIILLMTWVFFALTLGVHPYYDAYGAADYTFDAVTVNAAFVEVVPWVVGIVALWFGISYFGNTAMIRSAVGAQPLSRRDCPRVYNIVENLTIAGGMPMPKVNIVEDAQLNAFASGIDTDSYTVTVTTGLLDVLNDEELSGVIAHELTHIRNRDTRLLITSIIFVGIISTTLSLVSRVVLRLFLYGGDRRNSNERGGNGAGVLVAIVVAIVCLAIAYFFTVLTRFAISRKREFMADAGGAELCGNPLALASALRKISGNPGLQNVEREDVAQLFIVKSAAVGEHSFSFFSNLFSTHPDIEERIRILEQF